nr:PREDICTED: Down syndrome critical region protein 3 [Struthio camelus australis]
MVTKEVPNAGKKNCTKRIELSIQRPYLDSAFVGSQGFTTAQKWRRLGRRGRKGSANLQRRSETRHGRKASRHLQGAPAKRRNGGGAASARRQLQAVSRVLALRWGLPEILSGVVVITSKDTVQHQGISLTMEGSVNLQLSAKSVGVFEAFYNSVKPIQIINSTIEMVKPGKLPSGKTEIPFEFPLHMKGNKVLYETYHGVFVNIQYTLRCDMRRSLLAKDLTKTCEFIVHSLSQKGKLMPSPVDFTITPETLQNVKERASLPKFLIRGHLSSTNCIITQPLTGELVVENAEAAVKSIELQLVRVETCGCAEGYARDATEIQNIQIADGDVCRGLPIPIYMVFPRLFTCPTLETTNFKVEFEVNIVVLLHDDHLITENFPLKLCRM